MNTATERFIRPKGVTVNFIPFRQILDPLLTLVGDDGEGNQVEVRFIDRSDFLPSGNYTTEQLEQMGGEVVL
jgi:hypothetical protein